MKIQIKNHAEKTVLWMIVEDFILKINIKTCVSTSKKQSKTNPKKRNNFFFFKSSTKYGVIIQNKAIETFAMSIRFFHTSKNINAVKATDVIINGTFLILSSQPKNLFNINSSKTQPSETVSMQLRYVIVILISPLQLLSRNFSQSSAYFFPLTQILSPFFITALLLLIVSIFEIFTR